MSSIEPEDQIIGEATRRERAAGLLNDLADNIENDLDPEIAQGLRQLADDVIEDQPELNGLAKRRG